MQDLARRLGANARFFRESQGLSLSQLASRSGIAKSTLSQIEAGATNPTLATVHSLAGALSVDVKQLIDSADAETATVLIRRGEGADVSGESSIGQFVHSGLFGPSVVEFHRVVLEAGTHETSSSHGSGAREHVLVTRGRVRLGPPEDSVIAGPGDFAAYRGDRPHRFEALGAEAAEYWIVAAFPRRIGE